MLTETQVTSLHVRLATSADDILAVQRLRYDIFVCEGGADHPQVDHANLRECDAFDAHADHLMLVDPTRSKAAQIVGTYRLMTRAHAAAAGGFYSASEYDLSLLTRRSDSLLELGRSCLHPDYRGGVGLLHLWRGLGQYVADHDIALLFGVASLPGTDTARLAAPLSLLHHGHLARPDRRVTAIGEGATTMDLIPPEQLDKRAALLQLPALIKAYLRLGGTVGEGAYVDHAFNTTDVCLILDTDAISARQRAFYGGGDAR